MEEMKLGPNGSLIYCMDYLVEHYQWLEDKLQQLKEEKDINYVIFDCPGQVSICI